MDKLKLIKMSVFILTFLLIFGTLSILGILFQKSRNTETALPPQISLQEPRGSLIKQINQEDGKLYMLVIGGGDEDRIIIFDTLNGKKLSTIKIN